MDYKKNKNVIIWGSIGIIAFIMFLFVIITLPQSKKDITEAIKDVQIQKYKTYGGLAHTFLNHSVELAYLIDKKKPGGMNSEELTKLFEEHLTYKEKLSPTKLKQSTGITYEFISNGNCAVNNGCYVIVDTNGEEEPNQEWTDENDPKDIIKMQITPEKVIAPDYVIKD